MRVVCEKMRCTYRASLRLTRNVTVRPTHAQRGLRGARTEHLQGLPDRLLVQNAVRRVARVTILDTLHVLRGDRVLARDICGRDGVTRTCHLLQSELLEPCGRSAGEDDEEDATDGEEHAADEDGHIERGRHGGQAVAVAG